MERPGSGDPAGGWYREPEDPTHELDGCLYDARVVQIGFSVDQVARFIFRADTMGWLSKSSHRMHPSRRIVIADCRKWRSAKTAVFAPRQHL